MDISSLSDDAERYAAIQQITEFGQTPKLLFTRPHPPRGPGCGVPHALRLRKAPVARGEAEGGSSSSGGGGWGRQALEEAASASRPEHEWQRQERESQERESELEQAALDAAVAVVAGRGGFEVPPSFFEGRSGGGGGEVGAGQQKCHGGLRPLVEGSDSDADVPSWTAEVCPGPSFHVSFRRVSRTCSP